jgi:predicted ribosome quality control (RQC) complex YloA/Tae2 family protein
VVRGAASNDTLTFRESSPRDVWLHARDAAGAHVVLRWTNDDPPPARDLEEAAVLAAWHSKSRGAGLVPVDWTRRKYVRKARGGAPGLVLVSRAETIFVTPDERVERRLRDT